MHLLNLTPHPVVIFSQDGQERLWSLPSHGVCRVATPPQRPAGELEVGVDYGDISEDGRRMYGGAVRHTRIPLVTPQDFSGGEVTGIPEYARSAAEDGCHWAIIVGVIGAEHVARTFPGQVFVTDTGPASVVRSATGDILGVRRLVRMPRQS